MIYATSSIYSNEFLSVLEYFMTPAQLFLFITEPLVSWPISLLAFRRAIIYLAALSSIQHTFAFHLPIRYTALKITTHPHLCDRFGFFVLLIRAVVTGGILHQILDKGMFIGAPQLSTFAQSDLPAMIPEIYCSY